MPTTRLDQFPTDPGFVERAARLSCFDGGGGGGGGYAGFGRSLAANNVELGNAREESSVSDPASASGEVSLKGPPFESNARKRRAAPKGKGKETCSTISSNDPPKV